MAGKLYGIGVGPGDTGLMTLKAKEILDKCDIIGYPVKNLGEGSVALDIIKPAVDISGKEIVEFLFSMNPDDSVREQGAARLQRPFLGLRRRGLPARYGGVAGYLHL